MPKKTGPCDRFFYGRNLCIRHLPRANLYKSIFLYKYKYQALALRRA
ncbi:hypothetical protein C4J83_1454 [Pseudomonas sp. LBUM920]|nr:hypothetical protein C4J83_1454 [Pseudomonas sp. LBUM920]